MQKNNKSKKKNLNQNKTKLRIEKVFEQMKNDKVEFNKGKNVFKCMKRIATNKCREWKKK